MTRNLPRVRDEAPAHPVGAFVCQEAGQVPGRRLRLESGSASSCLRTLGPLCVGTRLIADVTHSLSIGSNNRGDPRNALALI